MQDVLEAPLPADRPAKAHHRKPTSSRSAQLDFFEQAPTGCCLLDDRDRILAVNRPLAFLLGRPAEALVHEPLARFVFSEDEKSYVRFRRRLLESGAPQDCELRLEKKDRALLWVHLIGISTPGARGASTCRVVVCDLTAFKNTELILQSLHVILAQINQAIVHFRLQDELFREICRIAVQSGPIRMAWIGLARPPTLQLVPVVHAGHEEGFLKSVHLNVNPNSAFSQGPIGQAFLRNQVMACNESDDAFRRSPWRHEMAKRGYRALIAVPFRQNDAVVGTLTFYFDAPVEFTAVEMDVLNRIGGALSFALDCFEIEKRRLQAEAALRESEAQNRALVHAIPDLVFVNKRDGEYLAAHAPDTRLLASPPGTIVHRRIGDLLPKPVATRCLAAIAAALDTGALQELTYSIPLNGQERHFEARIAPCTPDTVLTIVRDITRRKQDEDILRERETNYFDLFNTVKQAIYIQNPDSTFINVNQGAVDMYGYSREEFIGKTPEFLSAPGRNDFARLSRQLARAFKGKPQKFEFWGRRKDGAIFPKDVWVVKGKYFGRDVLISLANDISDRWHADEARRAARLLRKAQSAAPKPPLRKNASG